MADDLASLRAQVQALQQELNQAREVLGADLRTAGERVMTLEIENQRLRQRAEAVAAEIAQLRTLAADLRCEVSIKRCRDFGCAHGVAKQSMGEEWRCPPCAIWAALTSAPEGTT